MAEIIAIANQKGGVGKTTTTLNLAYSLHQLGKKVLTVDFDSQANLTCCYGIESPNFIETNIAHLMMAKMEEQELPDKTTYIKSAGGVDFIPSSISLSVVDATLRLEMGSELMLSSILEELRGDYDYIIIDTCPSLGSLTINALAAADKVIITVNPQLLAMMGLQDFMKTVKKIKKRINTRLEVAGILLTMCDSRTNLCKVLKDQVYDEYNQVAPIFNTTVPATVKV
ncbi:ParA family protein [Acetoanaerobium noterae]|uniref:ParA family protein n=1 Tax=Acetoanaerobium noterae TaxID=745369 RepID=UPI003242079E